MQIVYLSNRPAVLAGTLRAVAAHMPWIDDVLVCAPKASHQDIEVAAAVAWSSSLRLVADEEITDRSTSDLVAMDHATRNVTLRRALVSGGHTAERFVLSDDDYRPLTSIQLSDMADEAGRPIGRFFYDLAEWPGDITAYDRAQIRTLGVLRLCGAPTLGYGSHMPQLMERDVWLQVFERSDSVSAGNLVDEWTLYFGLGPLVAPDRFAEPRPFTTLAWPQWPHQWPHWVRPESIRFENHHPEHEAEGGLFEGLPAVTEPGAALERIVRWREAEVAIGDLRFDAAWSDPWTKGQKHRRSAVAALRAAKKLRKYTALTTDP